MRITFLGTGSILPTRDRYSSSLLVELAGQKVLLDCGPGTIEKMGAIGQSPNELSYVFITHYHIDHVLDLPALVKARVFDVKGMPNPSPIPLQVFGPPGLEELLKHLFEIPQFRYVSKELRCTDYLFPKEVSAGLVLDAGSWKVTATPVMHYGGLAYRIDSGGKSIVYSGDTVLDEGLIELSKGVDVLVHECSFPSEVLIGLHTSEKGLAEVAIRSRPKVLVAYHLYPAWEGREEELRAYLSKVFDGKFLIPKDLDVLEI